MLRFRSLVMALLLLSFLVPAAGAIYIPGQEIPDDGKPHILSAETGVANPMDRPGGVSTPALVPSIPGLPEIAPVTGGLNGFFSPGFPVQIAGLAPPSMPRVSPGFPPMEGNIIVGDVIGHLASPPAPGYWDDLQNMELHTNMPVINAPAIFE